ncbi:ABC transporter substrate-binding protein [Paenibacillus ginsengarvi]|uniref:Extracellular solute-binding protein n=1 Tax=Paenibacillus ginsengarvi TaxID=400777 RepID=A0A3B0CGC7_9BACL|nr:extracellular solute-binding protein [Paenibacillus ginsengarvi]RKN82126.1 extracellular solute-binding protein [Paenibacillus ginsengarvi]
MKRFTHTAMTAALLACLLASCGQKAEPQSSAGDEGKAKAPEPVTLTLYMPAPFPILDTIVNAVKSKYPHITLETIVRSPGKQPEELITAGTVPDLIYQSTPWYAELLDLHLLYDLNELIKSAKFDLNKLDPLAMDAIRMWGAKGEVYAIPFYRNFGVLYYNKDIFDKFGVAYPKDGMTWDDATELARKVTRTDGGTEYRGLDASGTYEGVSQLSAAFVDSNGKANLQSESFVTMMNNLVRIYSIPGNKRGANMQDFYKGTVAMSAFWNVISNLEDMHKKGTPMNWDMVSMPTYKQAPGRSYQVDSHNLSITPQSKHKEEAFQVIAYLTSKEVQSAIVKDGYVSSLVDRELETSFGANMQTLKGKNIEAIFKLKSAPLYKVAKDDPIAQDFLGKALNEVLSGAKDVNTALRDASELANQKIEQRKGAK